MVKFDFSDCTITEINLDNLRPGDIFQFGNLFVRTPDIAMADGGVMKAVELGNGEPLVMYAGDCFVVRAYDYEPDNRW